MSFHDPTISLAYDLVFKPQPRLPMPPNTEYQFEINELSKRIDALRADLTKVSDAYDRLKSQVPNNLFVKELAQQTATSLGFNCDEPAFKRIENAILEARDHATKPLHIEMNKASQEILVALAGAHFPTPEETYRENISWATRDAVRCIHQLTARIFNLETAIRLNHLTKPQTS